MARKKDEHLWVGAVGGQSRRVLGNFAPIVFPYSAVHGGEFRYGPAHWVLVFENTSRNYVRCSAHGKVRGSVVNSRSTISSTHVDYESHLLPHEADFLMIEGINSSTIIKIR
jgi:hypothetical protein